MSKTIHETGYTGQNLNFKGFKKECSSVGDPLHAAALVDDMALVGHRTRLDVRLYRVFEGVR